MEPDPPYLKNYKTLFDNCIVDVNNQSVHHEEIELPLMDLSHLSSDDLSKREVCKRDIRRAASVWGIFQVKNHGISLEIFKRMQCQQVKLFRQPFQKKSNNQFSNMSEYYKWGTPSATSPGQFSWSEAFHIPLSDILVLKEVKNTISTTIAQYAEAVAELGQEIAGILAAGIECRSTFFEETCPISSSYLRLNRYPTCPISSNVFGLVPHTDSDFLTVLQCQDQVGGLQIVKDGKWLSIKPSPESLIINIGDLFEALSNGTYKSVEHRVVLNHGKERFSVGYFLCPTLDAVLQCRPDNELSKYRKFTFREYQRQVKEDVKNTGTKVGLSRFLSSCDNSK